MQGTRRQHLTVIAVLLYGTARKLNGLPQFNWFFSTIKSEHTQGVNGQLPAATRSLETVLIETPVMRETERMDIP